MNATGRARPLRRLSERLDVSSPRANRVPERIKEIVAELVTTLKDPRVGFVTITDVRTTPDFGRATVFWTVLASPSDVSAPDRHAGPVASPRPSRPDVSPAVTSDRPGDAVIPDDEAEQRAIERTKEGLASATPMLRRELGKRLRLRQVPVLEFVHDPVPARGRRIEALLDEARPDR